MQASTLTKLIDRYWDKAESAETGKLIQQFGLVPIIEPAVDVLELYPKQFLLLGIGLEELAAELMVKVLKRVKKITDEEERLHVKEHLFKLFRVLMLEIGKRLIEVEPASMQKLILGMKQAVLIEGYDSAVFDQYMRPEELLKLVELYATVQDKTPISKSDKVEWRIPARLNRFIRIAVEEYDYFLSKREVANFFDPDKPLSHLRCNRQKKFRIAYLIRRLSEEGFVQAPHGAVFRIFEENCVDKEEKKLFSRLRRDAQKFLKDSDKFDQEIAESEEIIQELKRA